MSVDHGMRSKQAHVRLSKSSTLSCLAGAIFSLVSSGATFAADLPAANPPASPATPFSYWDGYAGASDWTGFYIGGHIGYAWGNSNWTASKTGAPIASGSFSLAQPVDSFDEAGSFFEG